MRRFARVVVVGLMAASCSARLGAAEPSFVTLADQYWKEELARDPVSATLAGDHSHDGELPDLSAAAEERAIAKDKEWLARFRALPAAGLGRDERLDLALVVRAAKEKLFEREVRQQWRASPREYTSTAVSAVYGIVKRDFAPLPERLKSVIAREEKMPALLAEGRKNLDRAPRVAIELALEELPANIDFLKSDAVQAFAAVKDPELQRRFAAATAAATAALAEFGKWLEHDLLPKAPKKFALGKEKFVALLEAEEGIDEPLDALLGRGEGELRRLQRRYREVAKGIDPKHSPKEVQLALGAEHAPPAGVIADIQARLVGLRQFIIAHDLLTVPSTRMATVQESPPFQRAFTLASMDTPGPLETKATEAYYNVTLPDSKWPAAQIEDYMRSQFSRPTIEVVSIHEVFPGHYLQFQWRPQLKSMTRKLFESGANVEGWAHYTEEMMLEEGFGAGDAKVRLSQLEEALLRATRFVVAIRMHTRGMTLDEAIHFFDKEGFQTRKVAEMEAKRGTEDAGYLRYTYGKLEILRLRGDYQKKLGAGYSLKKFHDAFLGAGMLPLPLMRKLLLDEPLD